MISLMARTAMLLGLLFAGAPAAFAQTSSNTAQLNTTSPAQSGGGLGNSAPALSAPTAGNPALQNPSATMPVPNIVVPPPSVPATPQPSCVTRECGLPVIVAPPRR